MMEDKSEPLKLTREDGVWVHTAHRCAACGIALACLWVRESDGARRCYTCLYAEEQ